MTLAWSYENNSLRELIGDDIFPKCHLKSCMRKSIVPFCHAQHEVCQAILHQGGDKPFFPLLDIKTIRISKEMLVNRCRRYVEQDHHDTICKANNIYSFLRFDAWSAICAAVGAGALLCHRRIFKRIFKSLGQVRAERCQCILCSVVATCGPGVLQRVTMLKGSWQLFGYGFKIFCQRIKGDVWLVFGPLELAHDIH